MENATKALIIAGAVLIAILLISLGIAIFKSTSGVEKNVEATAGTMAASTFNSQFTSYIGKNLTSAQLKSLASKIIANNAKIPEHQIVVEIVRHYRSKLNTGIITSNFRNLCSKRSDF